MRERTRSVAVARKSARGVVLVGGVLWREEIEAGDLQIPISNTKQSTVELYNVATLDGAKNC